MQGDRAAGPCPRARQSDGRRPPAAPCASDAGTAGRRSAEGAIVSTSRPDRLAIDGGPRTRETAWPAWPVHASAEVEAVAAVLKSGQTNYWTGQHARRFEQEYAQFTGQPHAVAVMNGTLALELALQSLDIGPGDEVLTSSRSYIASASCAVTRGARPVLADVDEESGNVTAETLRAALTERTRALIVVHLGGWPCDMGPIVDLARRHRLFLIEDCSQAHGARYRGQPVGSFGDAAAFSFCQDKILSTGGEGGMLLLQSDALWRRAWAYKDHGKSFAAVYEREHPPGFRWLHESFGSNWRMTEMQAAIGRLQLRQLPLWQRTRQGNAQRLHGRLAGVPGLRRSWPPADYEHAFYRYYVYLEPACLRPGWNQSRIIAAVTAEGIPCFSGSCSEIYREKAFIDAGLSPETPLPNAKGLGETSLAFLTHPGLTDKDMDSAAEALAKVMRAACTA